MYDGFYVDDPLWGGGGVRPQTSEVEDLYEKAKTRMAMGGLKLRKWLTNDAAFRKHIGEHDSEA
jgi:protein-disulfide isomerase-like protein with CxxC motif